MKVRNQVVDIAKGFSILAVVLGHNWAFTEGVGWLPLVLGEYRLPAFIFLSGVFFKPGEFWNPFMGRAKSILKPYIVVAVLGFAQVSFAEGFHPSRFAGFLYGSGWSIPWPWSPLWFLPHLLLIWVCAWLVSRSVLWSTTSWAFKLALLACMLVAGGALIRGFRLDEGWGWVRNLPWQAMPLSADLSLVTTAYFLLGSMCRRLVLDRKPSVAVFLVVFGMWIGGQFLFRSGMDLNGRHYDDLLIAPLKVLLGIGMVVSLSGLVSKAPGLSAAMAYIGSGSLFVLLFHAVFQDWMFGLAMLAGLPGWAGAAVSFVVSVSAALATWEIAKRNRWLGLLLLPDVQAAPEANTAGGRS